MADPAVIETHISKLVFTEDHVYKIKRAVTFGFVDLSTVAARQESCRAEVALNSRLAPDVYEGVGSFRHPDGHEEPVVVMKRLPAERRLSTLVLHGDPAVGIHLQQVAATIAGFHARAGRSPEIESDCSPQAVGALWAENASELSQVSGPILDPAEVDRLDRLARRYLMGRQALLASRVTAGRAVDGHGDLLADDIFCLRDGPRILDCLEFSARLRHCDTLSDVASLAADLERIGRPDLAERFLTAYAGYAGDAWPESLAHYYTAYRAAVRAKVACLRASLERDLTVRSWAEVEARRLLAISLGHLDEATVRLVLIGGLPGTGKSTLGRRLEAATGWKLIRSDVVRKQLAGIDPDEDARAAFGHGIYSPQATALVYAEMLSRAEMLMRSGHSVILDASWLRQCWRDEALSAAERCFADLIGLRCEAGREVAASRLLRRSFTQRDASDATVEIADAMAEAVEPWEEAATIDTSGRLQDSMLAVLSLLGLLYKEDRDTW